MMQKRTVYSLLLISFILVFALNVSAQVSFEEKNSARCESSVMNITVDPGSDVSAVEIVFEVTADAGTGAFFTSLNVAWDAGFTSLTNRIVDLSGVDYVSPDTVRIAAMMTESGDVCLSSGQTVIAQVSYTTSDVCDGVVSLDAGVFSCPSFDVETQFVDCATTTTSLASVDLAGAVTISNNAPTVDPLADAEIAWGTSLTGYTVVGHDVDEANGCEALTYSLVSGPATMTVNATTGDITWFATGDDVCEHTVEVAVEDACGAIATTSFNICVTNEAPVITCPADTMIALGDDVVAIITGSDPDGGPAALSYSLVSWDGPGMASVAGDGTFSWSTLLDDSYKGVFTAEVAVTDGANVCDPCSPNNADTCSFTVTVVNFAITIEKTHGTLQGQEEEVTVYMQDHNFNNYPMGGFDFLFQYDNSALTFQYAEEGQFITDCGWEYFTYRYGASGNCGTGCPSGEIRVTAIAETNNGEGNHPDCFTNGEPGFTTSNELIVLHFLVTNDRTFECMYSPVRFFWYDCGDNTISDVSGDQLFISNNVYGYEDTLGNYNIDLTDMGADFPSQGGANSTCDVSLEDGKPDPLRFIDFINGGVDIVCAESIDARGDINMNEIPYEIADAVLYSNYFIYGMSVFNPLYVEGQIAASDVNADGLTLSVADLVYLIRVVVGDADAYPKEVVTKYSDYTSKSGVISVEDDIQIGAAALVVKGDVIPELLANNMEMIYNYDGLNTRILVYPNIESSSMSSFSGDMVSVDGEIVSIEMADELGNPVSARWVPTNFALRQNYPNPFNPTTTLSFTLPTASNYELTIYNVNGQTVETISGASEVGLVEVEWDASAMASGVYFYRLSAGNFTDVKKMVLLK